MNKFGKPTKDVQTFVFDNLGQFGNPEEVKKAVNMLANAPNQLVVSSSFLLLDRQGFCSSSMFSRDG
eukprot:5712197-Pyramimonas_sp.AAC.1